jgi:signal transduction histidine kinase
MATWEDPGRREDDAATADRRSERPSPEAPDSLLYPRSVWNRLTSLLVAAIVAIPPLLALLMVPGLRDAAGLATATEFVVYPTLLGAAILLYVQVRLTGSTVLAWGMLCLTLYAVQGVMLAGLRAGRPGPFFERPGWILIVDLPVAALMLTALRRSHRAELRLDPLAAGFLAGLAVSCLNLLTSQATPELPMTSPVVVVAEVLYAAVGVAIGRTVYRLDGLPRWFLFRVGVGSLALVVNRLAICQDDHVVYHSVAVASGLTGAVLMVTAAAAGLRFALHEHRSSLLSLSDQVAAMEADERDSRARLHEITNSISSIAVASSLLHHAEEVSPAKRAKLEQMLEAEAGRLARILTNAGGALEAAAAEPGGAGGASAQELIDLDEVIEPLVISHQALRRRIDWKPSGHVAVGDPDAVAEAVNILLDNAARHAPQASTRIEVEHLGDTVEIAVRDDGPGVPEEVRRKLFEWGGRGADSKGQGIGLHLAHKLMSADGHSLRLEADRAGTSFVIGLPAPEDRAS